MKVVKARIVDATHLELSQPLKIEAGKQIQISIVDEDDGLWQEKAKDEFLKAYSEDDGIYDEL